MKNLMESKQIETSMCIQVDGISVEYGKIPSGLIGGLDGIVYYYFSTFDAYDTELHERVVSKVIEQLEYQSYDHGSEWRKNKIEAIVWNDFKQLTLVSFRVKDMY